MNQLVEDAMPQILGELDPHSSYIPAKDLEAVNSDLKGSFSGIGIQFTIQQDTIHISNVIQGGPSEKVGLMAGDRIISVNDTAFVGKIVTNYESMKRLKGPKGSEVKLGVYRPGEKEPLYFTIIRGDIPVKSVDTAYMLNEKFGYIKINKFGETTYPELLIALAKLNQDNCKGVIIDLRGNTGGYMGAAIQMVNEFLPKNNLIVYTQGRKSPRENYHSNGTGSSQKMPLIVLTAKFLPVPFRTMTAEPSSVAVLLAKDWYSNPSTSAMVRLSDSLSHGTILLQDVASRSLTSKETI